MTLTILGPKAKPVVHHPKPPPSLAGGLGAGWHALRVTVSWVLRSSALSRRLPPSRPSADT